MRKYDRVNENKVMDIVESFGNLAEIVGDDHLEAAVAHGLMFLSLLYTIHKDDRSDRTNNLTEVLLAVNTYPAIQNMPFSAALGGRVTSREDVCMDCGEVHPLPARTRSMTELDVIGRLLEAALATGTKPKPKA